MLFPCACIYTTLVPGAYRGQKRALNSLELKLQMVTSYPGGCWEQSPGPLEKPPISCLSSPNFEVLNSIETVKIVETFEVRLDSFCRVRWL